MTAFQTPLQLSNVSPRPRSPQKCLVHASSQMQLPSRVSRRTLLQSALLAGLSGLLVPRGAAQAAVDFDIDRFGDKEMKVSAINRVKQNLRNILGERPELLGGFILLALHDALTYDKNSGEGGPNGSLRFEGDRAQNQELAEAMKVIESARKLQRDQMSFADTYCFAGATAMEVTAGPRVKIQLGREDAVAADPEGMSALYTPGRSAEDLIRAFDNAGLEGPKDVVLFQGAFGSLNDIAQTRMKELENESLAEEEEEDDDELFGDSALTYGEVRKNRKKGPVLVSTNVSTLTLGGAKFSNDYLKFMLDAEKKKDSDLSDRDRKILAHPGMRAYVTKYAANNKLFKNDFGNLFEKVTLLGSRYESTKLEDR